MPGESSDFFFAITYRNREHSGVFRVNNVALSVPDVRSENDLTISEKTVENGPVK